MTRPIRLLLVVFAALALFYSLIIPMFEGPDEDDHFRYAKFIADHRALPVLEFLPGGGEAGHQGWQPPLYYSLVAVIISPIDTTDYSEHLWRNYGVSFVGDPACCGRNLYYHTESEDFPYSRTTLAVHIARLLSILFGAVTVWATYALVGTVLSGSRVANSPEQVLSQHPSTEQAIRYLPLAAAAVVAFNPSFLYASALVSNDTLLAALAALVLLVWVKLLHGEMACNLKTAAVMGVLIGLALLTKTTALGLIPFSVVVITVAALTHRDVRLAWAGNVVMLVVTALLAGGWLIRNQMLYGDPIAYQLMSVSSLFPRSGPLTLPELYQISLPWVWQTFWGGPTPGDFSPYLLAILFALTVLGTIGIAVFTVRQASIATRSAVLVLGSWLGFILIAQVQFIRTTVGADQGRYLFPAIPVLAITLSLGLATLLERWVSHRLVSTALVTAFALIASGVPFAYTLPAYARPASLTADAAARVQYRLDAEFGNQLQLFGYDVDTRSVRPGETLELALYWHAIAPIPESYRVFVHLIGQGDKSAGGTDVVPGRGSFPTVYWRRGDMLRDVVNVPVNSDAIPGRYSIEVGLYPVGRPAERITLSQSGDSAIVVGATKVAPRDKLAYSPRNKTEAVFGERIRLLGYDSKADSNVLNLALYWQAISPMEQDYTVFVHVLHESGEIVAQSDEMPQAGNYPTSIWEPGEQVRDAYTLALPRGIDRYRVEIGLYRVDSGERLTVGSGNSLLLDAFESSGK